MKKSESIRLAIKKGKSFFGGNNEATANPDTVQFKACDNKTYPTSFTATCKEGDSVQVANEEPSQAAFDFHEKQEGDEAKDESQSPDIDESQKIPTLADQKELRGKYDGHVQGVIDVINESIPQYSRITIKKLRAKKHQFRQSKMEVVRDVVV